MLSHIEFLFLVLSVGTLFCAVHVNVLAAINYCYYQDLQVQSPPPDQTEEQIYNDPAIIQVLTFGLY
jgi:hypothetical protein